MKNYTIADTCDNSTVTVYFSNDDNDDHDEDNDNKSSAVAEMAMQCSTTRIVRRWG